MSSLSPMTSKSLFLRNGCLGRGASIVLLVALCGCASVLTRVRLPLSVTSEPAGAGVYIGSELVGRTPLKLGAVVEGELRLYLPGYAAAHVRRGRAVHWTSYLNLWNVPGWVVDSASGALWRHDPPELHVRLVKVETGLHSESGTPSKAGVAPSPGPWVPETEPSEPTGTQAVVRGVLTELPAGEAEQAVARVLSGLADSADSLGCPPDLAESWREEAALYAESVGPLPDDERAAVDAELTALRARLAELCRQVEEEVEAKLDAEVEQIEVLLVESLVPSGLPSNEPIYFDFNSARIANVGCRHGRPCRDTERLLALAAIVNAYRQPVVLVLEGFADAAGDTEYNLDLGCARVRSVATVLLRAGVEATALRGLSYGSDSDRLVVPEATGDMEAAWLNRRVSVSMDLPSGPATAGEAENPRRWVGPVSCPLSRVVGGQ